MVNSLKIKSRMVELGLSQRDLATELGVSTPTLNQKINNKRPLHVVEAMELMKLLKIDEAELAVYFFVQELHIATN